MARSLNQVTLMGNLTRDPELRQTPNGNNVVGFSLALNSAFKNKEGNWEEKTDFIDVVAWGPLAERVDQFLNKGSRALVQGKLQSRSWEQDGQKRNKVEVQAHDVTFLDSKATSDSADSAPAPAATAKPKAANTAGNDEPINLDDIPF